MFRTIIITVIATLISSCAFGCDDFGGFSEECPLGDAVLVRFSDRTMIEVDCVRYDSERNVWIGVNLEDGKGRIEIFPADQYAAWNMDGQLFPDDLGTLHATNEAIKK